MRKLMLLRSPCPRTILSFVLIVGVAGCVSQNPELAKAKREAKNHDPAALYYLAKAYREGQGVPQNPAKAAGYMRQAAEQGYAFAQNDLGTLYAKGTGVNQDYVEAGKWYRKAAENGDPLAQYSMGFICFQGRGVPKDIPQSMDWYQKAAAQNQTDAIIALGDIHLRGAEGIRIDSKEALKWFEAAVKLGRVDALNSVGAIYETGGIGVRRDPALAFKCFSEAAHQGDARGQMNLGRLYMNGLGTEKDLIEAYKWLWLAQQGGEPLAKHYLELLEGESTLRHKDILSEAEIEQAKERAGAWTLSHQQPQNAKK